MGMAFVWLTLTGQVKTFSLTISLIIMTRISILMTWVI